MGQQELYQYLSTFIKGNLLSLPWLTTEFILAGLFVGLMILTLFKPFHQGKSIAGIATLGLFGIICLYISDLQYPNSGPQFSASILLTQKSTYLKILFSLTAAISVFYSRNYKTSNGEAIKNEFILLITGSVLGLSLMVMASDLLTLFVGMEIVSLSAYSMSGFAFDKKSSESALKYFVFGAFSTGLMLYGASILYGCTGTINFNSIEFVTRLDQFSGWLAPIGFFLFSTGLLFKISAFPFHIWTPDVYEGSPIPFIAFASITQKAAAVWVLAHFVHLFAGTDLGIKIQAGIAVIAILSITIGNFGALFQSNYRRLMAYSSIAHAGFILAASITGNDTGSNAILFYISVYVFMNLGTFFLLELLSRDRGTENIEGLSGLGKLNPYAGILMTILAISLIGLPPTAGFVAKFLVFSNLWEHYTLHADKIFLILFVWGLINTVISLFYYLRIPFYMFFKTADHTVSVQINKSNLILVSALCVPLIILFLKFDWLLDFIGQLN